VTLSTAAPGKLPVLLAPEAGNAARFGRFAAPITYALFGLADILIFGLHAHGSATFSFTPEFAKVSVPNLVLPAAATCYVCGAVTLALALVGEAFFGARYARRALGRPLTADQKARVAIYYSVALTVAGLRYGEGTLYTKNAGDLRVYWQGPSVGLDWGGAGSRTMMLIYNLPATRAIYQRFAGIDGSAYIIGGFGMTALTANDIVVVPIRAGVGLRLGANIGYLKFTNSPTWNPF